MAIERMAITPEVLTWARERAGYKLEDLAAKPKFRKIAKWESGAFGPTYRQLEQLADALRLPVAIFFFPEPPTPPPMRSVFRTLPVGALGSLSPRMRYLLELAEYRQSEFAELSAKSSWPRRLIVHDLRPTIGDDTDMLADKVRDYLGICTEKQIAWSKTNATLESWRRVLLEAGIATYIEDFRQAGFSSFALYDARFPVICVNRRSYEAGEALPTICGSLIHLLFHTSGFDAQDDAVMSALDKEGRQIAQFAERTAAEIVAPSAVLGSMTTSFTNPIELAAHITVLGRCFGVAGAWMNDRLRHLGLITLPQHKQAQDLLAAPATGGRSKNRMNEPLLVFGESFIRLAYECYDADAIDECKLAQWLEIAPNEIDALRRRLPA